MAILATDMATHFKLIEAYEKRLLNDETSKEVFGASNPDDRMFIV